MDYEDEVTISGQINSEGGLDWGVWCSVCKALIGERSDDDEYLEATEQAHIDWHTKGSDAV